MPYFKREGDKQVDIYFEDYGEGTPVVLIHGWPLSHRMWEYQVPVFQKRLPKKLPEDFPDANYYSDAYLSCFIAFAKSVPAPSALIQIKPM